MGGGAHHHGRDACRLRGGRRSRCGCVVDTHHDRRGEVLSSFPSFPLTFPTICPNVNRQPPLWAKPQHTESGGGAIPIFPRLPHVLRARITEPLPRPAPLVRMPSSHVTISDVPILCSRCSFVAVLRVLASPKVTIRCWRLGTRWEMSRGTRGTMTGAHLGDRGACRRRSCSATAAPREGGRRRGHGDGRHHPRSVAQLFS